MISAIPINDYLTYLGVNDRDTQLFENQWPLPYGVSYNAFLIKDEKNCLMDTVKVTEVDQFLACLKDGLDGGDLDYIVVHHVEPDHSSALSIVRALYPKAKLVGNKKTFEFLKNFYQIDDEDQIVVDDGESLNLGKRTLTFYKTPMVHWPESMVSFIEEDGILFSQDIFGTYGALDGAIFDDEVSRRSHYAEETARYYVNIVSKYNMMAGNALKKLGGLDIRMICPDHGPIWREKPADVLKLYQNLTEFKVESSITIVYGSMYGNTQAMAEIVARELAEEGIKDIKLFDVSKTDASTIQTECWKSRGIILGSCTYDKKLFPPMKHLVGLLDENKMKNHVLGIFGNYSWASGAMEDLQKFADAQKGYEVIDIQPNIKSSANEEDQEALKEMARAVAKAVKKHEEEDTKTSFTL
ncbi:FprA family A-type flavoprotein [Kallipyga massiliensis]|uniref:FprA family A-type flavoprotein n=1 Tax=Kallipyga massiliensis TaxID=1472764 RepID=UPI0004B43857|nr:FprA family A-type flavoprotein [Kallipyga massiliensis]